jgi:hypothetical protein
VLGLAVGVSDILGSGVGYALGREVGATVAPTCVGTELGTKDGVLVVGTAVLGLAVGMAVGISGYVSHRYAWAVMPLSSSHSYEFLLFKTKYLSSLVFGKPLHSAYRNNNQHNTTILIINKKLTFSYSKCSCQQVPQRGRPECPKHTSRN